MNVQIARGTEAKRPEPKPFTSSLLDHVRAAGNLVTRTDSFGLTNNAGLWPSYNCLDLLVPTPICPDPLVDADSEDKEPKEFSFPEWMPAIEFALYGGVQCRTVGLDKQDMADEVRRVFALKEGRGIEEGLLKNRFTERVLDPSDPFGTEWDEPVDITPVTTPTSNGVPIKVALAVIEGYARRVYAGVPTIHMPAAALAMLDVVKWDNDLAYTPLGSKIAVGGGYDFDYSEGDPHDGTMTLYATGEVYIEQSEQVDVVSYVLPGDGSLARGLPDNTVVALAERQYRVAVDCFVVKATGTVWK